jgi:lipopolysaccharide transport system ATP-binding protein
MSSAIKVENLSKKFIIGHEEKEKYTALRDVMTRNAKKIFSFPFKTRATKTTYTTEEFWALKDINFEIKEGDRVGIIGRNGAGKSTLLKILSRITEPSSGSIRIRGRVASLLEVGTGFHPELSGRENIFLNGAILGMARAEIRYKFDEIVAFAEVEKFLDTPVKRYSSGMYVRLAFAVAAHLEPEILIVDEVLAVGDAQFQKKCLGKMEDVSKNEGRTVLFVSHSMGVVSQLCNSGILLKNGQISYMGTTRQAIEKYLGSQQVANEYRRNPLQGKVKKNFIEHLIVKNEKNEHVSDFSFSERITLQFSCFIGEYSPNLQIGVALQDKLNSRVFTVLKEIDYFMEDGVQEINGSVTLPQDLLAPNYYTFSFALWTKEGNVQDMIENVCAVNIHDDGTELAQYENTDYGCVIIKPKWSNNV